MAKQPEDPQAEEIARLYGLAPERFVAERDAAARRLRAAGDADAAKRVKALRKPNLPAAAINRAVRAEPGAAGELIAAGEALEAAQAAVLAGGDASDLRAATAAHGEAVEALMGAVAAELGDAGGGAADRARETLRAAAADAELRDELAAGTLVRDREGVGFGAIPAGAVAPRPARERKPRGRPAGKSGKSGKSGAAPKAKGSKRADEAAARKRAEQALRRAERALEAAESRAQDAERRLERAKRGLAEAKDELADAKRERGARDAELKRARKQLDRL